MIAFHDLSLDYFSIKTQCASQKISTTMNPSPPYECIPCNSTYQIASWQFHMDLYTHQECLGPG